MRKLLTEEGGGRAR